MVGFRAQRLGLRLFGALKAHRHGEEVQANGQLNSSDPQRSSCCFRVSRV